MIVITSDRGLAGAYNSNVLRQLTKELQSDRDKGIKTKLIVIGKQAAKFVAKIDDIDVIASYDNMPEKPTIADLNPILNTVKEGFKGKVELDLTGDGKPKKIQIDPTTDAVDMLYTDYKSSVVQEVTMNRLLPAAFSEMRISQDLGQAIFEPSPQAVLDNVADKLVDVQLWQAYLESQASEQSARMMAMKTASDNAGDLIDDLTLAANTARQAAITQELAEITGGAEAMK
jgi:F-type H+-transporting ATPase subunit gamma